LLLILDLSLYAGVPSLQGTYSGPGPTSGEVASPQVGPNFWHPVRLL
jgi:hypothetical protein